MKYIFILGGYVGLVSGMTLLFYIFSDYIAEIIARKTTDKLKGLKN